MKSFLNLALASAFVFGSVRASPIAAKLEARQAITIPGTSNTGPAASTDPNESFTETFLTVKPEPIRGKTGAPIIGPTNDALAQQNADLLAPPSTDAGFVPAAKWPFSLSHNRLTPGGWARQQNVDVLPSATEMAGVNMRLLPGAIREMHWHTAAEWAYMIAGSGIVGAINEQGQNYLAEVNEGDLWYFPAGVPHYIQASNHTVGCEFLLVFDSGTFNEDSTFLLTDWTAHTPKAILDKNFQLPVNSTAFDSIPASDLWIFQAPEPASVAAQNVADPNGTASVALSYAFSQQKPVQYEGGTVKIQDATNFPASQTISAALVTMEPGSLREMHWHPNSDEWEYYIRGEFRTGIFAALSADNTFDFQAGDVGYIKQNNGHWIECISNTTCEFLEVLKAPQFIDVSLSQWLAVSPVQVVADHLRVSNETINAWQKTKPVIVKGDPMVS